MEVLDKDKEKKTGRPKCDTQLGGHLHEAPELRYVRLQRGAYINNIYKFCYQKTHFIL
jgi:hypothetical protein